MERISIGRLCRMLKVSSRTLRYYEEIGLIKGIQTEDGAEREFTKDQADQIEDILFLRSYGFCLNQIYAFMQEDKPLGEIFAEHEKNLKAECEQTEKQVREIKRAITMLDERHSIYECLKQKEEEEEQKKIAVDCLIHLNEGDIQFVCQQISSKAACILTSDNIQKIWNSLVCKYGQFKQIAQIRQEGDIQKIRYQTVSGKDVEIGFGFHGKYIITIYLEEFSIGLQVG